MSWETFEFPCGHVDTQNKRDCVHIFLYGARSHNDFSLTSNGYSSNHHITIEKANIFSFALVFSAALHLLHSLPASIDGVVDLLKLSSRISKLNGTVKTKS